MTKAAGAKKASESQKAKALWPMKAAWDRSEEFYDAARKEDVLGRKEKPSGIVGRTSQRPVAAMAQGVGMLGKSVPGLAFGFHSVSLPAFVVAMAFCIVGAKILQNVWERPHWEGVWPYLDLWDIERFAHNI